MEFERLPLWHFFHDIEKFLSYERWIDKYRLFMQALLDSSTASAHKDYQPVIIYDEEWTHLKKFIKYLYLQDLRDEQRFDELLDSAIIREKELLRSYFQVKQPLADRPETNREDSSKARKETGAEETKRPENNDDNDDLSGSEKLMEEPPESTSGGTKYYQPPAAPAQLTEPYSLVSSNYLHTDEYFPVTRRQMIKGWQFLRLKEKSNRPENIDIEATIEQIARDGGLFLEAKYLQGFQNRLDTLIIFADYRGSMTPFHELTNRLIQTARSEGGHPRAPVFYFQNYPIGYVYRQPNLTKQVKLKEALVTANRNFTMAIVISDAGAARGNTDTKRVDTRVAITNDFLEDLSTYCAHTIWLNPMPAHRWNNTAAMQIKDKVMLMAPILDHNTYHFQDTMRTILKHTHTFQKNDS